MFCPCYFHVLFAARLAQPITNLDVEIQNAQDEVYNYFATTCGTVPVILNENLAKRYADCSIKSLKRSLRSLKKSPTNQDFAEIRYVSALIRSKLQVSKGTQSGLINVSLEKELKSKFWSTCHSLFNSVSKCVPTFNVAQCQTYFYRHRVAN